MVTYGTFTIVDISDGAQWYSGTSITNTSTTPTIFPNSGVLYAVEGDMYLNTSTQNTYRCVEDGDASHAKWVYVNNIKGENGVGITSIVSQYCLSNDSTSDETNPHDVIGTWSTNVPPYIENKYYWTRQYVTWDDGSHSYSPDENGALDNSLTDANRNAYEANNKDVAYQGVCDTGETVGTKVVTSNNFSLSDGTVITVLFTAPNKSTGLIQLNVNDTGNKDIYVGGTATGSTNSNVLLWGVNAQITFVYNSNHWVVSGEPRTWHGNCPSTVLADTSEKPITISEVVICKGTTIVANMANGNTSTTPSLNITALGAINLYYGTGTNTPTLANGYGWTDNSTTQFVFDGLYWRMADSSTSEKTNDARKVATNYLSADSSGIMIADLSNGSQTPLQATGRNVFIDNTSVNIRNGHTVTLAKFDEDEVTIGEEDKGHTTITNSKMIIYANNGQTGSECVEVGTLGAIGDPVTGLAVVTEILNIEAADGSTVGYGNGCYATYVVNNVESVLINDQSVNWQLNGSDGGHWVDLPDVTDEQAELYDECIITYSTFATLISVKFGTNVQATGANSFAIGERAEASGSGSSALGFNTKALGIYSFATGRSTKAMGDTSIANGWFTQASGDCSHTDGAGTIASGYCSYAGGTGTIASADYQTAIGRYNTEDANALFVVGNGNGRQRSTAFKVNADGSVNSSGTITQNGNPVSLEGHTHDASDIITGVLPIGRGGTGNDGTYSTTTVSDICTAASGWSVTQAQYCSWGKVATIHLAITKNNTAGSGIQTLCTLKDGKRPKFSSPAQYGWHDCAIIGTDGTIQISDSVAANTTVQIRATYVLA